MDTYESSDDEGLSVLNSQLRKFKGKERNNDDECSFFVGQLIPLKETLNEMVKSYALHGRRDLYIKKNDPLRFRVICLGNNPNLVAGEGPNVSSQEKLKRLRLSYKPPPNISVKELKAKFQQRHQAQLSESKMRRAKTIALQRKYGDHTKQYTHLRSYIAELLKANPGSFIKLDVEPCANPNLKTRQFRRIYVCYAALVKGFKLLGREILGLDGCFMKGKYPGQILTAVGTDGNNCLYHVALAIVEAECTDSWKWFLNILGHLDLPHDANFTFISNRQKGLIQADESVFPRAEHRFCCRHIHENLRQTWRGYLYKGLFYRAASATSVPYFNMAMEEIKKTNLDMFLWLSEIPAARWSRSHFLGRAKSDMLLNNLCESFNKQLVGARDKPIITYLEYIREYMIMRIVNVKKMQATTMGPLKPQATKAWDEIQTEASKLTVMMVDEVAYQVKSLRSQCVVNVEDMTCTCRIWDLTGMPCKHVVAALHDMIENNMHVGPLEKWVDEAYWLDTWKKVYMHQIRPIPGPDMWAPSKCPTILTPPKHHTQIGRPNNSRKKALGEKKKLEASKKRKMKIEEVQKVFYAEANSPGWGMKRVVEDV
ncbi:uncharacterized protein LOC143610083 [Bidens hawaiensis]|uniref:uncharacterized protein LOC143610083 n=1 Tax=Bidens hawaiensis TaxID=980011 RepID=UPI00404B2AC6